MFDGVSNVIGLLGMGAAARPADREHPYGHTKYETFASAAIGALLLMAAWRVGSSAIGRLADPGPGPQIGPEAFVILLGTLAINITVTLIERRAADRLGSEVLRADAGHTASDVLVTLGVIGGLVAVRVGYPIADPIIALVVAGFIIITAGRVLRSAGITLADTARLDPGEVSAVALAVEGVLGCHHVRTRGTTSEVHVDLHIQVDPAVTVAEGHAIAERVERAICESLDGVVDVIAHLEPFDDYQRRKTEEQAESGML
jgi:cation diffusion facilitator family transporter